MSLHNKAQSNIAKFFTSNFVSVVEKRANIKKISEVHSFCKLCLCKDLVFINRQLMSALASLERFGEEDLVFIN